MTGCRISKVTDKRTGRSVHVLQAPRPASPRAADLMRQARMIAMEDGEQIDAFAVIALRRDGSYQIGWGCAGFYGPTNTTAILTEVIRREIATQTEAVEVFNRGSGLPPIDPA